MYGAGIYLNTIVQFSCGSLGIPRIEKNRCSGIQSSPNLRNVGWFFLVLWFLIIVLPSLFLMYLTRSYPILSHSLAGSIPFLEERE